MAHTRAPARKRELAKALALEDQHVLVPLWRTIAIIGSVVMGFAGASWHVSQEFGHADESMRELRKEVGVLVASIDKLTSDKIGRTDLALFCAQAQNANPTWHCPSNMAALVKGTVAQ